MHANINPLSVACFHFVRFCTLLFIFIQLNLYVDIIYTNQHLYVDIIYTNQVCNAKLGGWCLLQTRTLFASLSKPVQLCAAGSTSSSAVFSLPFSLFFLSRIFEF